MTHKRPRRRTMRQCMHIFFTDDFTFIRHFYTTKQIIARNKAGSACVLQNLRTILARPPYGSSCTETLSPTSTFILWSRIFPARYARIVSPSDVFTRKRVFGSASSTTPSTIRGSCLSVTRTRWRAFRRCLWRISRHGHSSLIRSSCVRTYVRRNNNRSDYVRQSVQGVNAGSRTFIFMADGSVGKEFFQNGSMRA